ncbi:hypothetical protein SELMODRAFT_412663 [Selaginella moellendorffii]|uniref:Xrn1 N-terminal domain-containing protein n=1 Tax=Selaginella moellendorffii TaxID=88036 RepID=D8RM82_SELML|nr:hypothetical protein SELMODRAFT_412663 [Selaginella moellendorffii]
MTSSRLQWIVSTSEEDGEGELKIFNHIRALPFNAHDFHCVVGRDADLIMLALASPLSRKINIVHQTPKDGVMIYKLISIETLVCDFEVQMEEPCSVRLRSTMRDLVFLCFLLGNDFLPGLEALTIRNNGIDKLQQTYMEKSDHQAARASRKKPVRSPKFGVTWAASNPSSSPHELPARSSRSPC